MIEDEHVSLEAHAAAVGLDIGHELERRSGERPSLAIFTQNLICWCSQIVASSKPCSDFQFEREPSIALRAISIRRYEASQ